MCGIAGIIHFNGQPVDKMMLENMGKAIAHRGPDGAGIFIHQHIGFAHQRLSVIDLSADAAQPMTIGGCTITFNGEIYNYRELRNDLEKKGFVFKTQSDTEVILAAYLHWGTKCVHRFCGMWAFALSDSNKNLVFLSRDRFGKKPLYYFTSSGTFYFFSEIKAALTLTDFRRNANEEVLAKFLFWGETEIGEHSFFENVRRVPASHNLLLNAASGSVDIKRYYQLQQSSAHFSSKHDAAERIRQALEASVSLRLRSDVPVAISLSGGLDSASVAAIAANMHTGQLNAFTAGTDTAVNDERKEARKIASVLGLRSFQEALKASDFERVFHQSVFAQEEPFDTPSVLMQQMVMEQVQEHQFKVLLGGQGADEVMLGYLPHFPAWMRYQSQKERGKYWRLFQDHAALSTLGRRKLQWYFADASLKGRRNILRWYGKVRKREFLAWEGTQDYRISQRLATSFEAYMDYQLFNYGLPKLLRYEDKNSMSKGIETRMPFMDHRLVELVCSTPLAWRMADGWTKYLLRLSMEESLPAELIWQRGKVGFAAPDNLWKDHRSYTDQLIRQSKLLQILLKNVSRIPQDNNSYWRALSVAAWEKEFSVV